MPNDIFFPKMNMLWNHQELRNIGILAVVTIICLIPFVNKAVHIDDPLFIWTAKQIQTHPLDPYNFTVNWDVVSQPMYEATKNPPGASYYMALAASVIGWNEPALHIAFFIPVIGFVIGVYVLAKWFCSRPFEASLVALLSPVVLVSSTTLMCDVLMLCLWVWSTVLWMKGVHETNRLYLLLSSLLIVLCALTKYFGMNLILLLFVWTITEKKRLDKAIMFLIVPVVLLIAYQWATATIYGRGLLIDAASYATEFGVIGRMSYLSKLFVGFAFTGGCFIPVIFYAPQLWRRSVIIFGGLAVLAFIIILSIILRNGGGIPTIDEHGLPWSFVVQFSVSTIAGIAVIILAVGDIKRHRDAGSLFLLLWVVGTFLFTVVINWTINGRSLLPLAPAIGILIMRTLDDRIGKKDSGFEWKILIPLVPAAVCSFLVTYADYRLANTVRDDVKAIWSHPRNERSAVWFQGHWGFQYYMERSGGKALDPEHAKLTAGDIIIVPLNNTSLSRMSSQYVLLRDSLTSPALPWLSCMNHPAGAGFYSDVWGPLPFVFGAIPPERYEVYVVREGLMFK